MDGIKRYNVRYTARAMRCLDEKVDYISWKFGDSDLAEKWYFRLRKEIQESLSTFPYKYQIYDVPPWNECKVRLFLSRKDVVAYLVDEDAACVRVIGVCTKGKEMTSFLTESMAEE